MDRDDVMSIVKKARSNAGDGIKKASEAAKKAASGVSGGLESAKDGMRKASLAKDGIKTIQVCIKELEEENKATNDDVVNEETKRMIRQMKYLSKVIKQDPENCESIIDEFANECRVRLKELLDKDAAGEELLKVQVLTKHYEDAILASQGARTAVKEAIKEKRVWYIVRNDSLDDMWMEKSQRVIDTANKLGIECSHVVSGMGDVSAIGAYCNVEELQSLLDELGNDIGDVELANTGEVKLFERNII